MILLKYTRILFESFNTHCISEYITTYFAFLFVNDSYQCTCKFELPLTTVHIQKLSQIEIENKYENLDQLVGSNVSIYICVCVLTSENSVHTFFPIIQQIYYSRTFPLQVTQNMLHVTPTYIMYPIVNIINVTFLIKLMSN